MKKNRMERRKGSGKKEKKRTKGKERQREEIADR